MSDPASSPTTERDESFGLGDGLEKEKTSAEQAELFPQAPPTYLDEMNFVEMPVSLLTRDDQGIRVFEISEGVRLVGNPEAVREHLVTEGFPRGTTGIWRDEAGGLPTALGEHVLLALLSLTWDQNRFESDRVEFDLPELVRYMYPDREYKPNQTTLWAIEEQIWRIVSSQWMTDRWYDAETRKKRTLHVVIIQSASSDGVQRLRGRARRLWIQWGEHFFQSIRAKYTKELKTRAYLSLTSPLERRFYRWLDRQLTTKREQAIHAQVLAPKLAMTAIVIKEGGRRASAYIVRQLADALKNYRGESFRKALAEYDAEDFHVVMNVDKSTNDYVLRFSRIDGAGKNEVIEKDDAGELVREFYRTAHGRQFSDDTQRVKLSEADRKEAAKWLQEYSLEQALAIVRGCVELHKAGPKAHETIHIFRGMDFYRQKSASNWEARERERRGQLRLKVSEEKKQDLEAEWQAYKREKAAETLARLTAGEKAQIEVDCEAQIRRENAGNAFIDSLVKGSLSHYVQLRLAAMAGAMTEAEFKARGAQELGRDIV